MGGSMATFRLEQVLDHRKHLEEAAQTDLSRAQRRLQEETAHLQTLEARRLQLSERLRGEPDAARSVSVSSLYHDYLHRLQGDMARQADRIRIQAGVVEEKRRRLVDVVKQRKVIETLKQQHRERQRRKLERHFQQFADDAGIAAYNRSRH